MQVYIDIVFFINFIMDFFIFWISAKLVKQNVAVKRILAASASAALLYCLSLFAKPIGNRSIIFSLIIIIISVFICFKPKGIKELVKFIISANICAFTMAGAGTAVFYYIKASTNNMFNINIIHFPFKILIFSSFACFALLKFFIAQLNKISLKRQSFCNIKLYFEKKKIELTALIDTGNSLCEPITGKPVIISEFKSIKEALPEKIKLLYYENKDNDIKEAALAIQQCENKSDFSFIPFSSLGEQSGIIMAVRAKKAEIMYEGCIKIEKPYIAVCNLSLSKKGSFDSLINPEMLKYQEV